MDQPQKVTKRQTIKVLFKEGKKAREIQAITGFSLGYIKNTKENLEKPGVWNKRQALWLKNHPDKKTARNRTAKKFRKNNPEKRAKYRKRNEIKHAIATRPHATNHR